MNNLVIITYKSNGDQKLYTGDYSLMCKGNKFVVTHGPFKSPVFNGSRNDYFVDIESLDDDD